MIYFEGSSALSEYRHHQLLKKLQSINSRITEIDIYFDYFVEEKSPLSAEEIQKLTVLLPKSKATVIKETAELRLWVIPRVGTISPWSSKATDIAHICGLEKVQCLERGVRFIIYGVKEWDKALTAELYDRLTESVIYVPSELNEIFQQGKPAKMQIIPLQEEGRSALEKADQTLGLALSADDMDYLLSAFNELNRDPTDVELMMFAQVNSEHCRHKIFNAHWTIDGQSKDYTLFDMIRYTYQQYPEQVLVAYKDNAAVMRGDVVSRLIVNPKTKNYEKISEAAPYVLKVETHNHPTAISPFPGAATGSGGEIRDEAATGRGAKSTAGLCGFTVSNLTIPGFGQPWETCVGKPAHIASAFDIMQEGPIGAASFNNEFGRPNILGFFRTFEMLIISDYGEISRGYHKPIMIAGGVGQIRDEHIYKKEIPKGAPIIALGGPAMTIGLGGGAASSRHNDEKQEALDFASVQRSNPEMQRRAQEVINACCALGDENPILSIHDVGAGGLSNALPELVQGSDLGGKFYLRAIPNAEPSMSPAAIWCNEAQERYVLAVKPKYIEQFSAFAHRERCPFAIVGEATKTPELLVEDRHFNNNPVQLPMSVLFEDMPQMQRQDKHAAPSHTAFDTSKVDLADAIERVLQFPCVASKNFLITIGDRSVGGMVARDQFVGPWQCPVANCGVVCNSFEDYSGQAMAMGERPPIALLHHAASARMAVGEAITNIVSAAIADIGDIVLSANWMAAADYPGEGAGLYDAVQTIAMELCPSLKIAIPVGKDSLSMRTTWESHQQSKSVTSPLSVVITASANVTDVRRTLTPQLKTDKGDATLILIDLGKGTNLLGGSVLLQSYNALNMRPPDVDDPRLLRNFFKVIQALNQHDLLLAYHDRSDGGLLATVSEMMFASHHGVNLTLDSLGKNPISSLFAEELGAVIQVKNSDVDTVLTILEGHELEKYSHRIGELNDDDQLTIYFNNDCLYQNSRVELQRLWSATSYHMQALRDHADFAKEEYDILLDTKDPGLNAKVNFEFETLPNINKDAKPKIAILREQGVNGQMEMAAAFDRAGFLSVDVHMSDLIEGRVNLSDFKGLAACGGFSYGDVLGAGRGWAQSILMFNNLRDQFQQFFERRDTFSVGMCNGCQMLAYLRDIIPGAQHWPYFTKNNSEQFEARLALVEITPSPSIVFNEMAGSVLPVVVSHAQGYANFSNNDLALQKDLVALRYVDHHHNVTEHYPFNPNGSPEGITALTTTDGRVTMMMPHPERVFRTVQLSWHPADWPENSPWMKLFYNARAFVA